MLEDLKQDSKIWMNCSPQACRSRFGFTLAEVLIVIGIIGVVAALTLPNLNHATGDKEKVTKVKKIYSALTEALDRAQAIYGPFDTWFDKFPQEGRWDKYPAKRITEFMKISKECGYNEGCFSTAPMSYPDGLDYWTPCDNLQEELESRGAYSVMLPDGVSMAFFDKNCFTAIRVDIDGPNKGKNMWGSDIFEFDIGYDIDGCYIPGGKINELSAGESGPYVEEYDNGYGYSSYAAVWVIEHGNLDYLKCPEELNWETKTSCE